MDCYSEQACALFVDDELPSGETHRLIEHLGSCRRCRELVDALRVENQALSESLRHLPEEVGSPAPAFHWRSAGRDLAVVAAMLGVGSMASAWIDQWSIPAMLEWLNPIGLSGRSNLIFNLFYYIAHGGAAMVADYAAGVGRVSLLLLLGGSVLLLGRRLRLSPPGVQVMTVLMVLLMLSLPGFAMERRHGPMVSVASNETVDDTLLAAGNTVRVDGVVNGDLLAFGRAVEVRGTVKGDLISWAQRTVVSGTVQGRIYSFSQGFDFEGQVDHGVYAFTQSLRLDKRSRVGEDVTVFATDVSNEGEVKRGMSIFAGNADISGTVGRDLNMTGGNLVLTDTARVEGNLNARVRQTKDVHIDGGAFIGGKRDIQLRVVENRFTRTRFYFFQALWLAAAMLVGWLGVALFPGFFHAGTQAVGLGWRTLLLGVGVLAGVPLVILVAAITLVGLPLSLMLLALYVAALYLTKIWVGAFLGRILLRPAGATKRDWLLGLLVGLLILTILGFVPYFGGLVRFGVVCLGLGAFAWQLYQASSRPQPIG